MPVAQAGQPAVHREHVLVELRPRAGQALGDDHDADGPQVRLSGWVGQVVTTA